MDMGACAYLCVCVGMPCGVVVCACAGGGSAVCAGMVWVLWVWVMSWGLGVIPVKTSLSSITARPGVPVTLCFQTHPHTPHLGLLHKSQSGAESWHTQPQPPDSSPSLPHTVCVYAHAGQHHEQHVPAVGAGCPGQHGGPHHHGPEDGGVPPGSAAGQDAAGEWMGSRGGSVEVVVVLWR